MKMNELILPYSAILFFLFICCKTEKKDNSKCITSTSELESIEPTLNYYKGAPSTDSLWINTLDKLEEPSFMRQGDYINVYFKYDQIVEGYEVIAKWKAFGPKCETGYLLMNFYNTRTGRNFQYISEKYSNYHTRELAYLDSFNGFQEGDIFHFEYIYPQNNREYKTFQLGYHTPFQFLDIDFDGEQELLVNDDGQYQGGNFYEVYKITTTGLVKADYVPLNCIQNNSIIDTINQTITIKSWVGAAYGTSTFFSKQKNQVNPIRFPKLHENDSWITEYYRQKNNIFSLDSIHEFFNDTVYIYYLSAEGHFILKDSTVLGEVIPIPDNIDDVTK